VRSPLDQYPFLLLPAAVRTTNGLLSAAALSKKNRPLISSLYSSPISSPISSLYVAGGYRVTELQTTPSIRQQIRQQI